MCLNGLELHYVFRSVETQTQLLLSHLQDAAISQSYVQSVVQRMRGAQGEGMPCPRNSIIISAPISLIRTQQHPQLLHGKWRNALIIMTGHVPAQNWGCYSYGRQRRTYLMGKSTLSLIVIKYDPFSQTFHSTFFWSCFSEKIILAYFVLLVIKSS